jgi:hypothetical protein
MSKERYKPVFVIIEEISEKYIDLCNGEPVIYKCKDLVTELRYHITIEAYEQLDSMIHGKQVWKLKGINLKLEDILSSL